jgi:hypothetical protein
MSLEKHMCLNTTKYKHVVIVSHKRQYIIYRVNIVPWGLREKPDRADRMVDNICDDVRLEQGVNSTNVLKPFHQ